MPFEFKNYQCDRQDVRRAIEQHGQPVSNNKLMELLTPVAHIHHFKFVDWNWMKEVVLSMVRDGELERIQERNGYYRYGLREWI